MNANEYGALVSLIYNVGCGQYSDTSIKAAINSGRRASDVIAEKFPDYSKANGAVVDGLVTRRHEEIAFAKKPTNMISYPCN